MKRFIVFLVTIILAVPLALGSIAGLSYYMASDVSIPRPTVTVMRTELSPCGFAWSEPVFGGMITRDFYQAPTGDITDLGVLMKPSLEVASPEGYSTTVSVTLNGLPVYSGDLTGLANYQFLHNGSYLVQLKASPNEGRVAGSGTLDYRFSFSLMVEPQLQVGNDWISQGDMLALRVYNLPDGILPTVDTDLAYGAYMLPSGEGQVTIYLPLSHTTEAGGNHVTVTAGSEEWELNPRVVAVTFPVKHLVVEETDPAVLEAALTAQDWQYNDTILPLLDEADDTRYWQGLFITPVSGRTADEYGMMTYTNQSGTVIRHTGVDIDAARGTEVVASNSGRVVYTGYLNSTGNIVIIEHGGGLKTLYQHLNEITVEAGDMVERGQQIGTVGSSGSAAKNHLHFEVRLGRATVNPTLLTNGASCLYSFE